MVLPLAFLIGFAFGIYKAKKRSGNRMDQLHYGVSYGIIFLLLALFVGILGQRIGLF